MDTNTTTDRIDTGWILNDNWRTLNYDVSNLDEFVLRCSICDRKLKTPEKAVVVLSVCGGEIRIWDEAAAAEQQPWQADYAMPISDDSPYGWAIWGYEEAATRAGKKIDNDFMGACLVGPECRKKYDPRLYAPASMTAAVVANEKRIWEREVNSKAIRTAHYAAVPGGWTTSVYGWTKCTLDFCAYCEEQERWQANRTEPVALPPLPPIG